MRLVSWNLNVIKLIAFDLDGTLINAYQAVATALNRLLHEFGFDSAEDEVIQRHVGWGQRKLLGAFLPEQLLDEAEPKYQEYHGEELPKKVKFLPGAKELLDVLSGNGYRLIVATNRPIWSTTIILDCLQIKNAFDFVLSGEQVARFKPEPDIIYTILDKYQADKDELLYVGDMTVDAITGNAAGVRTVVVTTGSSTREEIALQKPYKIVDNVLDVARIVEEINDGKSKKS